MRNTPFHPELTRDGAGCIMIVCSIIFGLAVIAECVLYGAGITSKSKEVIPTVMLMLFVGIGLPCITGFLWSAGIIHRIRKWVKRNIHRGNNKDDEVLDYVIDMALSGDTRALELSRYISRNREIPEQKLAQLAQINETSSS